MAEENRLTPSEVRNRVFSAREELYEFGDKGNAVGTESHFVDNLKQEREGAKEEGLGI